MNKDAGELEVATEIQEEVTAAIEAEGGICTATTRTEAGRSGRVFDQLLQMDLKT